MTLKDTFGMPIKGNGDDGDSMLWSGLMVAVGDSRPIAGIRQCQGSDGRLWRSPDRVNLPAINSFSRDMALGFILYFQKTQDHEMADAWINYIRRTGGLFPHEEASDNRFIVTPALWWLMSYAGMNVHWFWRYTRGINRLYHKLEMRLTPRGFETHLQAVATLIMNIHDGKLSNDGKYLSNKEPNNAFFAWLAGKKDEAQHISKIYRSMYETNPGDGSQWCWERADSEEAWHDSMGWDFEFIDQLCKLDIT